ncbi:hypothetical protein R1T08_01885 [Streptomyces sp. SBC-4]|nr:hypothetical protein [Streptomyces sp. SBC-4]MDV5143100.1 hypothetical protein [Streptomyces sp. SBC-4]
MTAAELLRGKVVVVSGVGSGLGRTLAVRCAGEGRRRARGAYRVLTRRGGQGRACGAYETAKSALLSLARSLANEPGA